MTPTAILLEAKQVAEELMAKHGLKSTFIYNFKFDNSKRRFGACCDSMKYISLSKPLTLLNWVDKREDVINTILHEIAHALVWLRYEMYGKKCEAHGREWKAICVEIGCRPERCYEIKNINAPTGNYIYRCPNCGKESHYFKRKKRMCACGDCCKKYNNGKFDKRFILQLVVNGQPFVKPIAEPIVERNPLWSTTLNTERYKEALMERVRQRTADRD